MGTTVEEHRGEEREVEEGEGGAGSETKSVQILFRLFSISFEFLTTYQCECDDVHAYPAQ